VDQAEEEPQRETAEILDYSETNSETREPGEMEPLPLQAEDWARLALLLVMLLLVLLLSYRIYKRGSMSGLPNKQTPLTKFSTPVGTAPSPSVASS